MNRKRFKGKQCRQLLTLSLLTLLGFVAAFSIPTLSVRPTEVAAKRMASVAQAQLLLQQGIERYEADQFAEAVELWQQAASAFAGQKQGLGQALALSHLSLAYQQLGQMAAAEEAIASSLTRLKTLDATVNPQAHAEISGKALNANGRLYWAKGQTEQALATWQQAARAYLDAGYDRGVAIAKINQARALQELGLSVQAAEALQTVYQRLQRQPHSDLKAMGLQQLGQALRQVGHLERSLQVLRESVNVAQTDRARGMAQLELGNSERAASDRAIAIGQTRTAKHHEQSALRAYETAAAGPESSPLWVQAQLNRLSLLVATGQHAQATALVPRIQPTIDRLPPGRARIYAQLNFARSLTCLRWGLVQADLACINRDHRERISESLEAANSPAFLEIVQQVTVARQQASQLQDPIAESYALGQLGKLYELDGQLEHAQTLTEKALFLAQAARSPDLRYRWQWQWGHLLAQQGQIEDAIDAYRRAVKDLEQVRGDLRSIDSEVQFSFRDQVEPVYRELVDLLLTTEDNATPSQTNLKEAIQHIDALQLAELENFLGCDLSQSVRLGDETVDFAAATLYPIVLPDRLAVIFEIPGQPLGYQATPVDRATLQATLQALRNHLTDPGNTPEALAESYQLYRWLIEPLEPVLAKNKQLNTLVFVLDGAFRNIPMGVLFDGEQYLIEKGYAVAIAPRLKLFRPTATQHKLTPFIGGISMPQMIEGIPFPPIDNLQKELDRIVEITHARAPLLNQDFTNANIEQQLQTGRFSAIHWKTHGVFSSDPEKTYIVTYQGSLKARDLNRLLQIRNRQRVEPLELLVLSACETAQGDNRAILGLAGIAVRAGARSTVSTLWRADDWATTVLMTRFYQELTQPGTTKAQALQRAQLALLQEAGQAAPHIWATYILVGNWL